MLTWLYILKDHFVSSGFSLLLVALVEGQIQVVERKEEITLGHWGVWENATIQGLGSSSCSMAVCSH